MLIYYKDTFETSLIGLHSAGIPMLASSGEPQSSTSVCVLAQKLFESAFLFLFYFYYYKSLSDELFGD